MAAILRPVSHFPDENPTLRSFSPPPHTRPSLESSSMKSRKSFLDLIVPARRLTSGNTNPAPGSKLKQVSEPTENMVIANASDMKAANRRHDQNKPAARQKAADTEQASKNPLQRPRSKTRTILRVISTTFRSRSPAPSTSPPPANPDLQAKQNREAALRERGLLPPKPNKDLSRQEADRDRRIPTVPLDRNSGDGSAEPSVADLIKREWEARNNTANPAAPPETEERERMKSFRFGASAESPSQILTDVSRSTQLETVSEANPPLSPILDDATVPPAVPAKDPQGEASSHHRSSASAEQPPLDPTFVPLPSSPLPTPPPTPSKPGASQKSNIIPPAMNPSSPSYQSARHGKVDSVSSSGYNDHSGSRSPSSLAPPLTNPIISLTPPSHINSFGQSISIPLASFDPHRRSESLTQMPTVSESSSLMTPSLDNSSSSPTTISTLNTIASSSVSGVGGAKGKNGLLKIKTSEQTHAIPMIIESPVEDAAATKSELMPERIPLPLSPVSQPESSTLAPPQNAVLTRRERGLTDPGRREKRKLFSPFKRDQSINSEDSIGNRRRISVSSSLVNLKRAASNWTRPRSSYDVASMAPSTLSGRAKTFDASHLPASPTVPSHFMTSGASPNSTSVGLAPPNRKPLHPTLHNRASILHEMNAIKDDEVRRMTEVAFLG